MTTTEQARTALTDRRIPALVRVLRDGTEDQVLAAYFELIGANGLTHGHELWDAAVRKARAGSEGN